MSNSPIELLEARALQPRRASIGPSPRRVLPGRSAIIPFVLKTEGRVGPSRYQFSVKTALSSAPVLLFDVSAVTVPVVTCEETPRSATRAESPDREKFLLLTRRAIGVRGLGPAMIVGVSEGMHAELVEDLGAEMAPSGCVERVQRLKVRLREDPPPGRFAGEIRLAWDDGFAHSKRLFWETEPELTVIPKALVLKKGDSVANLLIRPTDPRIVVTGIEGDDVASFLLRKDEGDGSVRAEVQLATPSSDRHTSLVIKTRNGRVADYRIPIVYLGD